MSDFFNKHIKKTTARTKEKLLEGLGRNKATQDEAFDFHASNIHKQSKACEKLYKDLKGYSAALKELDKSEKALRESIRELYEEEWPNRPNICAITQSLDCQTEELEKTVSEDILGSVGQYVSQFGELKKKIEKRGRKLVDYDHARNTYNSLKESSKKGESDPKVAKAFTELQQAEGMYKEINGELLELLPATYDSRITFVVDNLQTFFNAHATHQTEASKYHKQLVAQLDQLGQSIDTLRVPRPASQTDNSSNHLSAGVSERSPSPCASLERNGDSKRQSIASTTGSSGREMAAVPERESVVVEKVTEEEAKENGADDEVVALKVYPKLAAAPRRTNSGGVEEKSKEAKQEKDSTNPFDETDEEDHHQEETKERKFLYEVRATHKYAAADSDELSFAAGEHIKVLETFEADQMDEGWLMGEREDGTRGVFPANFTKKVD